MRKGELSVPYFCFDIHKMISFDTFLVNWEAYATNPIYKIQGQKFIQWMRENPFIPPVKIIQMIANISFRDPDGVISHHALSDPNNHDLDAIFSACS